MDFSSANVPISRETWAPRSPVRTTEPPPSRDREEKPLAPPRDYDRPPPSSNGGEYKRERDDNGRGREEYPPSGGRGGGYDDRREPYKPHRPTQAPRAEPNQVLGVFGLSIRTRERDLEDEFMRYGDVDKVVIVYDQRSDRSRGFGFITMHTTEDAMRCVEKLNGLVLHGRPIRVDYSATAKPHAPTPGEYMGTKRPSYDDRGRSDRYDDRRGPSRYDDRRGGYDRYDDRDRRDRDYRRDDDPYGGRARRGDDYERERRRSPSPRRSRYDDVPERKPAPRDYDAPPPAEVPRY